MNNKQEWSTGRKVNAVDAYTSFLQMQNKKWEPPQYRRMRKLPFIPTENEVDQNRRMQQTNGNLSPAPQRNWHKMRRSMQTKMDRHRRRKPISKSDTRKRQQPKATKDIRQTNKHAQRLNKRLSNNIPTRPRRNAQKLPKTTQTNRIQTPKPMTHANQLPHTTPLQGYYGIS